MCQNYCNLITGDEGRAVATNEEHGQENLSV